MLYIPNDSWQPVTPGIVSTLENRSPELYMQCCRQFPVETGIRWKVNHDADPTVWETYCNIYMWDCTVAMSAEIPHWINEATGEKVPVGKGKELSANGVCRWLQQCGEDFGWTVVAPAEAVSEAHAHAKMGRPVVATWLNPKGIGHVAMLLPTEPAPRLAQAGGRNFFNLPQACGFGNYPVTYYWHL